MGSSAASCPDHTPTFSGSLTGCPRRSAYGPGNLPRNYPYCSPEYMRGWASWTQRYSPESAQRQPAPSRKSFNWLPLSTANGSGSTRSPTATGAQPACGQTSSRCAIAYRLSSLSNLDLTTSAAFGRDGIPWDAPRTLREITRL